MLKVEEERLLFNHLRTESRAVYTKEEFAGLLNGKLPSGESTDSYHVDDVERKKVPDPFGRYAMWMPVAYTDKFDEFYSKEEFMQNKLLIARSGTLEYLEEYLKKSVQYASGTLGFVRASRHLPIKQGFDRPLGFIITNSDDARYLGVDDYRSEDVHGFIGVGPEATR